MPFQRVTWASDSQVDALFVSISSEACIQDLLRHTLCNWIFTAVFSVAMFNFDLLG